MARLIKYGLARAGKVKNKQNPRFFTLIQRVWSQTPIPNRTNNPYLIPTRPSKYLKRKRTRRVLTRSGTIYSNHNQAKIVGNAIEKQEFQMEKRLYSELREKNWDRRYYRRGRNHKKWNQNHREAYSSRESIVVNEEWY